MKNIVNTTSSFEFPQQIAEFTLVGPLSGLIKNSHYHFAIYENVAGQQFVCKLWSSKQKDQYYQWIQNEIHAYEILNKLISANRAHIQAEFPHIQIPEIHYVSITDTQVIFIMDKVEGELLSLQDPDTLLDSYEQLIEYFQLLTKCIQKEPTHILRRTVLQYFVLFHAYFLKSLLNHPDQIGYLITKLPVVYKGMLRLLSDRELVLVHRDLGGLNNVFINKKKLSIIDFENLTFTYRMVQLANIIITKWSNQPFIKVFFTSELFNRIRQNPSDRDAFKALLIYGAMVDLGTGTGRSKAESIQAIEAAIAI